MKPCSKGEGLSSQNSRECMDYFFHSSTPVNKHQSFSISQEVRVLTFYKVNIHTYYLYVWPAWLLKIICVYTAGYYTKICALISCIQYMFHYASLPLPYTSVPNKQVISQVPISTWVESDHKVKVIGVPCRRLHHDRV